MKGIDPRAWDLHQMLAAYESTLQQGAKDEAAWNRTRSQLYAEPPEVRQERADASLAGRPAPSAPRVGMTLGSVEALLASAAARDAQYGTA